jgi:hypothetical protein
MKYFSKWYRFTTYLHVKSVIQQSIHHLNTSFIIISQSILRQIHSLRKEFSFKCDLVLHFSISSTLPFPQGHSELLKSSYSSSCPLHFSFIRTYLIGYYQRALADKQRRCNLRPKFCVSHAT